MTSIALTTYSTVPRGSVVHTAHLADALVAAGCAVTVYALDKDGRGFFRPLRAALRLVPAGPTPATTADLVRQRAGELAAYVQRLRPRHDVWHAQDCLTANALLRAREQGDLPGAALVRTVHHVERFADPFLAACQERSIRRADACVAVSEAARADVRRSFAMDAEVVGNGVAFDRFHRVDPDAVARWRARFGPGGPILLAVGGVEERKNTLGILRAFARLRARASQAQLLIVGGATVLDHGAYRAAYTAERDALPPDARGAIHELGVVAHAEVPALFHAADVLVSPSSLEGFGLVALEALAAGLPLVVANRPPFTEYLDERCAELVDPEDADAIAAGVEHAIARGAARRARGLSVARSFSWVAVAARHVALYRRLCDARDALSRSLA